MSNCNIEYLALVFIVTVIFVSSTYIDTVIRDEIIIEVQNNCAK